MLPTRLGREDGLDSKLDETEVWLVLVAAADTPELDAFGPLDRRVEVMSVVLRLDFVKLLDGTGTILVI